MKYWKASNNFSANSSSDPAEQEINIPKGSQFLHVLSVKMSTNSYVPTNTMNAILINQKIKRNLSIKESDKDYDHDSVKYICAFKHWDKVYHEFNSGEIVEDTNTLSLNKRKLAGRVV